MVLLNIAIFLGSAFITVAPQIIGGLPPGYRDMASAVLAFVLLLHQRYSPPTLAAPPVPVAVLAPPPPPITIVKP